MKKHIYEESNRLSYTMHGDYYLPDLVVNETGTISVFIDDGGADDTLESSCSGSQRTGENYAEADGGKTGCDGTNENAGSDEMGWFNE